jgi:hypothetical protein
MRIAGRGGPCLALCIPVGYKRPAFEVRTRQGHKTFKHTEAVNMFQSTAGSIRRPTPSRRIGTGWIVSSLKVGLSRRKAKR